jgi:MFS family permease
MTSSPPSTRRQRASFWVVNAGYLAVTCGESLLAPVFPMAAHELGLTLRDEGFAFAILALSIAIGNLVGGLLLWRRGPRSGLVLGLLLTSGGAVAGAASGGSSGFLGSQVLLGLGSGLFFASGLSAAGDLGGPRRGVAMGLFGVAFSGGLALAALLVAGAGANHWRVAFAASAAISGAALAGLAVASLSPRPRRPAAISWTGFHRDLGVPLAVGGMAAASQYGTVSFLATFAVRAWGVAPSSAAGLLAVARVLSIPGKVTAGHHADRRGGLATAGQIGLALAALGALWTLVPGFALAAMPAVAFAAGVSALGPLGNILALEAFADKGIMLGVFRSAQTGLGALASALLGAASAHFGLRPSLAVAGVFPVTLWLLALRSRRRTTVDPA